MPIDPSRLQTDKDLPEYLAKLPFDLSHPSRRELRNILVDRYWNQARIVALLDSAELKPGWFALDTSSELAWVDILRETRARDKLHRLLDALLRDSSAAAWHPRLREMLADVPVVAATPPAPPVWQPPETPERLMGPQSTLLGIAFLAMGVARSGAVVRIKARFGSSYSHGSGFLITRRHVLTNHHVLFDKAGNRTTEVDVWFRYELGVDDRPVTVDRYTGIVGSIKAHAGDDWAIAELAEPLRGDYPILPVTLPSRLLEVGDRVYIIQHPQGGYKQIGMHRNIVTSVTSHRVQYLTDTELGSSGSPVFNDRWELVALHHSWVDIAKKDSPPEYRNQGIAIERIVQAVSALPELMA